MRDGTYITTIIGENGRLTDLEAMLGDLNNPSIYLGNNPIIECSHTSETAVEFDIYHRNPDRGMGRSRYIVGELGEGVQKRLGILLVKLLQCGYSIRNEVRNETPNKSAKSDF